MHNRYKVNEATGYVIDGNGNAVGRNSKNSDGSYTYKSNNGKTQYNYATKNDAIKDVESWDGKSNFPFRGTPGQEIDPAQIDVFRGGTDMSVKWNLKEARIDPGTGLVKTSHGISLDTDSTYRHVASRGAHRIKSIPDELKIIQRGSRSTHYEIVPRKPTGQSHEIMPDLPLNIAINF